MMLISELKEVILEKFSDKPFTCGDVYYSIESKYYSSKFGIIRNLLVKLTKEQFLHYKLEIRGYPHYNSEKKKLGAVYTLK